MKWQLIRETSKHSTVRRRQLLSQFLSESRADGGAGLGDNEIECPARDRHCTDGRRFTRAAAVKTSSRANCKDVDSTRGDTHLP
jgi:hypothetical protein